MSTGVKKKVSVERESSVQVWLMKKGFQTGALRREKKFPDVSYHTMSPMARGCYEGEVVVIRWLYEK